MPGGLADALTAQISELTGGGGVRFEIRVAAHQLELRVGPVLGPRVQALMHELEPGGFGSALAQLSDHRELEDVGSVEVLLMRLGENGRP